MNDICGDNRFEIIAKAKEDILKRTNIYTNDDEMKVLDDFLFRCWQMGWLNKYDEIDEFKEGNKCADNNPKSSWISVKDDLPCNHPELLHNNYTTKYVLALDNGYPNVKYMSKLSDGNWYWLYAANVTHWMPIPKLDEYNVND